MGFSTPEICRELGLDSDAVIRLLIHSEEVVPSAPGALLSDRREGRRPQADGEELIGRIVSAVAREDGAGRQAVWTFPDLARAMRWSGEVSVSRDTLRRYLGRQGFTFPDHLRRVTGSTVIPEAVVARVEATRALLYVVSHRICRSVDPVATLIAGVTPSNRLALSVRHQGRLSPGMVVAFLAALPDLHAGRHVVVLMHGDGAGRTLAENSQLRQQRRLHLYLWCGG